MGTESKAEPIKATICIIGHGRDSELLMKLLCDKLEPGYHVVTIDSMAELERQTKPRLEQDFIVYDECSPYDEATARAMRKIEMNGSYGRGNIRPYQKENVNHLYGKMGSRKNILYTLQALDAVEKTQAVSKAHRNVYKNKGQRKANRAGRWS